MTALLAFAVTQYAPPASAAWIVTRDEVGRWCVESRLPWRCRVCLSVTPTTADRSAEERARSMADALNRVYTD